MEEREPLKYIADLISSGRPFNDDVRTLVVKAINGLEDPAPKKRRTEKRNAIKAKALQAEIRARAEHLKSTARLKGSKRPTGGWVLAAKLEVVSIHGMKSVAALDKMIARGKAAAKALRT
jgi:hypothetical protein